MKQTWRKEDNMTKERHFCEIGGIFLSTGFNPISYTNFELADYHDFGEENDRMFCESQPDILIPKRRSELLKKNQIILPNLDEIDNLLKKTQNVSIDFSYLKSGIIRLPNSDVIFEFLVDDFGCVDVVVYGRYEGEWCRLLTVSRFPKSRYESIVGFNDILPEMLEDLDMLGTNIFLVELIFVRSMMYFTHMIQNQKISIHHKKHSGSSSSISQSLKNATDTKSVTVIDLTKVKPVYEYEESDEKRNHQWHIDEFERRPTIRRIRDKHTGLIKEVQVRGSIVRPKSSDKTRKSGQRIYRC